MSLALLLATPLYIWVGLIILTNWRMFITFAITVFLGLFTYSDTY